MNDIKFIHSKTTRRHGGRICLTKFHLTKLTHATIIMKKKSQLVSLISVTFIFCRFVSIGPFPASAWVTTPSILSTTLLINESSKNCGEKLFFTELIEEFAPDTKINGKVEDEVRYVWREQARVNNISDIKSYSGFFTVNREFNSNLFFWFVPAAVEPEKSPIIIWLNGGPGTSSLFGLFVENGPFKVNSQGFLENRQYAWTLTNSMLYIDNPVGTGFSFTENVQGYSKTQMDVAANLYQALTQFYRAFPEYAERELYIAGESYAGKYVPSLAIKIHIENNRKKSGNGVSTKIKLKGMIIGSGLFDPYIQNEYGDYLYQFGLIDEYQKEIFAKQEANVKELIESEEWADATRAIERLIVGDPETSTSLFQNMTGFSEYLNLLEHSTPNDYRSYVSFINRPSTRAAIHVGDQPYTRSPEVLTSMVEDISKSVKVWVERLLKENYRMLIYASQFDLVVPHTGIGKFISNLDWPGARLFARVPRVPWRINGEIAGYTKFARNLAYVLVRKAGHVAPYDQPLWIYEMVNRFTRGKAF